MPRLARTRRCRRLARQGLLLLQALLSRQGLGMPAHCLSQERQAQLWWLLAMLQLLLGQGSLPHRQPQARLGLHLLQALLWARVLVSLLHCRPQGRLRRPW